MGKKRKQPEDGEQAKDTPVPKVSICFLNQYAITTQVAKAEEKRLIVVLEDAHLESCKTGKEFSLLNIDEHRGLLSRNGRDFSTGVASCTIS